MNASKRTLAAAEVILIFPAVLFMTSLFVRNLEPQQFGPAYAAQQIVLWFSAHPPIGLWVLLITLPLAVLVVGFSTLLSTWGEDPEFQRAARQAASLVRAHLSMTLIAAATLAAGIVLVIVALHVVTN